MSIDRGVLRDQIDVILAVNALVRAGVTSIPLWRLHAEVFLCHALEEMWQLEEIRFLVVKEDEPPRIPAVQGAFDSLVAGGLLEIHESAYPLAPTSRAAGGGKNHLDVVRFGPREPQFSSAAEAILGFEEERVRSDMALEIALGSGLDDDAVRAFLRDFTYSDPHFSAGSLLFLGQPDVPSPSVVAADRFQDFASPNAVLGPGRKTALYMQLLKAAARSDSGEAL